MVNSNQNIMCSDFESRLEKYKAFSPKASPPLQWFPLTLLLHDAGAWSARHGGRVSYAKKRYLILSLCDQVRI